jgi:Universal stress protein family
MVAWLPWRVRYSRRCPRLHGRLDAPWGRGDEIVRILLSGDVATEIAQFARTGGFHLIVMPTHAGSFRRMLLGSTTAKVVFSAKGATPASPNELAKNLAFVEVVGGS